MEAGPIFASTFGAYCRLYEITVLKDFLVEKVSPVSIGANIYIYLT